MRGSDDPGLFWDQARGAVRRGAPIRVVTRRMQDVVGEDAEGGFGPDLVEASHPVERVVVKMAGHEAPLGRGATGLAQDRPHRNPDVLSPLGSNEQNQG